MILVNQIFLDRKNQMWLVVLPKILLRPVWYHLELPFVTHKNSKIIRMHFVAGDNVHAKIDNRQRLRNEFE